MTKKQRFILLLGAFMLCLFTCIPPHADYSCLKSGNVVAKTPANFYAMTYGDIEYSSYGSLASWTAVDYPCLYTLYLVTIIVTTILWLVLIPKKTLHQS